MNGTGHISKLPEILFITSYPPRECGIATYSQDLIRALNGKFSQSFKIIVCPVESDIERHTYRDDIKYILNINYPAAFNTLASLINEDTGISMVMIQHEFGLFKDSEDHFRDFLYTLNKPVVVAFHTVLPHPDALLKQKVKQIAAACNTVIVMTNTSADVLTADYEIRKEKIAVIPHGTHLVAHTNKLLLKQKYKLAGKKVLSTFGLLSSGKNIETTLHALPAIAEKNPDVQFLIIGKTHPAVVKQEGETYRIMLEAKVKELHLQPYVKFVNYFLPLPDLLEYLQLTDIYLFTSRDPNQAVSGTFSYAISCGCPVISTPIPHAREVLQNDAGIIIDFESPVQLAAATNNLLSDEQLRTNIGSNGLHRMASTAWENTAIAHALLFEKMSNEQIALKYRMPAINLNHLKKMTTDAGMVQFAKMNQPDIDSGYTIDDNARAMIAFCQHFELTGDKSDMKYITVYLNFIKHCQQADGSFLNYVNEQKSFTLQNTTTNLADANGRAIWALGYLVSISHLLPLELSKDADAVLQEALENANTIHSTRAMAFIIKGLYYRNIKQQSVWDMVLLRQLADRLVQMYRHEAEKDWQWFESYLTYGNSILPEALLCAWQATGELTYKEIARSSFDFLLSKIFSNKSIKVISNKGWLYKNGETEPAAIGGEQPIDVAYTILALGRFYAVFQENKYLDMMHWSFNWFLGDNHLHQVIYNPCTGGCYDGLEEDYVNLNQGAESAVSYLMARLTAEKYAGSKYRNMQAAITAIGNEKQYF